MGVHVSNGSFRTSNKGVVRQVFNFAIGAAGAVGTLTQAGANVVSSVTRTAQGIYTIQFNKLYPVRLIYATAHCGSPAVGNAMVVARVDSDSFSATNGTLIVNTSGNTGAGDTTQIAADPADGAKVYIEVAYVDQTTGIAN